MLLEPVAAHEEGVTLELELLEALERADAVVAARERLDEQTPQGRRGVAHARGQQLRQRPRAGHELLEALVAVRSRGVGCERGHVRFDRGVSGLAGGRDHRLVEVAEAHLAREVRQHGVAAFEREHQVVEGLAEVVAYVSHELLGLLETAVEDRDDRRARRLGPLLGQEHPVARVLERGRAIEALDPVVSEGAAQPLEEAVRQPLGFGVEGAQPRVQVLLVTGQQRCVRIGLVAIATGEQTQVSEHLQQAVLAGD